MASGVEPLQFKGAGDLAVVRVEASRECRNAGHPLDAAMLLQAFRSADFALNHLAVGEDLCAAWGAAEDGR